MMDKKISAAPKPSIMPTAPTPPITPTVTPSAPRGGNNPFATPRPIVARPPRAGNNPFGSAGTTMPRPPQRPTTPGQRPQGDRPQGDRPQGGGPRPGMSGPRPGSVRPGFAARPAGSRPPQTGGSARPQGGAPFRRVAQLEQLHQQQEHQQLVVHNAVAVGHHNAVAPQEHLENRTARSARI